MRRIEGPDGRADAVRRGRVLVLQLPRERLHGSRMYEPEVPGLRVYGLLALDEGESATLIECGKRVAG